MKKTTTNESTIIHITAPNIKTGEVWIKGTAPLVIHKFDEKVGRALRDKQAAGSTANTKKGRSARDFDAETDAARHISFDGWDGIHAGAFRNACIRACSLVGFKMTMAKITIFVEADGFDKDNAAPLVRIYGGKPRRLDSMVRIANGSYMPCSRPQWLEWGCRLRFRYDADQFTASDVVNLIARVGAQIGVGEGRPGSTNSNGCGWGTFEISTEKEVMALEKKGRK